MSISPVTLVRPYHTGSCPQSSYGMQHGRCRNKTSTDSPCVSSAVSYFCCLVLCSQDTTVLSALLQQNPQIRTLDLEGNSGLPDRLMYAAAQAASCSSLKTLDLSGCQLLSPGAYVPDWCPGLTYLDISDTATTDAGVVPIAARLTALRRLALAGCRRVSTQFRCLFVVVQAAYVSAAGPRGWMKWLWAGCTSSLVLL
jgi:hypothetical protein